MLPTVGFAPAPQIGTARVSACAFGTGGIISSQTKNPDLAWEYFEYFFGGQPATDRAKSGFGYPAKKSLLPLIPHATAYDKAIYAVVQHDVPYQKVVQLPPYITQDALNATLRNELVPVINGQANLTTAAKQITAQVNRVLQQGKAQIG